MRALRPIVAIALLAGALTACSGERGSSLPRPSKAFCVAAYTFDDQAPQLIGKIHQQIDLVQRMADHAPTDIEQDAQLYLDALQRRAEGDMSVVDNPKVEAAVDRVNRRAADGCDLYKQNRDGSSGI
jgi:hypothetical protein